MMTSARPLGIFWSPPISARREHGMTFDWGTLIELANFLEQQSRWLS
jgi:hypothetical protein